MDIQEPANLASELTREVESLRSRFPDTQHLYREVCALLFFRYGITPTANKLYQLVRKGSMSAPAEALARFWENLREKSRLRIEHPDLPPQLAALAGEVIGGLWHRAQADAQASYSEAIEAHQKAVADAQSQAAVESGRAESAAKALFQLQAEFSASLTRTQEIEHELAREQGQREVMDRQLASAVAQRREMQEALAAARHDFEVRLEAQRQALLELQARQQVEAQRLGLEVDRERAVAASLRRDIDDARRVYAADGQRYGMVIGDLQQQVSQLRQELGLAEGAVAELRATRDLLQRQLDRTASLNRGSAGRQRGRIVRRP